MSEGRERFRRFLVRRDGGGRCAELAPLLSAFADDEADEAAVLTLREHLRTCAHCRATLRAYRAVPPAAAALLPVLPPVRGSLLGRLHDAYAALATRVGGGSGASDSALGGVAAAGGTRGAGMAALAKVLAICAGTVGGAAACVATGVVPAPLLDPPEHHQARPATKVSRHLQRRAEEVATTPTVEYETEAPAEAEPEPQSQEAGSEAQKKKEKAERESEESAESASSTPPPSESGAVEYTEPETVESTSSTSSASGSTASEAASGSAAGEFGP
ncbi:MAG: zf-HC2 domain-containing protein [Solirubrobacterales bacterium]